eukprot:scaffold116348_cov69-Phaeocystis_antarctica.AAC.2
MLRVFVALDVSKYSGWLNTDASPNIAHVNDAGRVEAQRLVEHRRALEHVAHVCDAGRVVGGGGVGGGGVGGGGVGGGGVGGGGVWAAAAW